MLVPVKNVTVIPAVETTAWEDPGDRKYTVLCLGQWGIEYTHLTEMTQTQAMRVADKVRAAGKINPVHWSAEVPPDLEDCRNYMNQLMNV